MITRFSVPNLHETTIHLTNVVNGKILPDKILINAKILSTYTDTILENKETCNLNKNIKICKLKENLTNAIQT